MYIRNLKGLGDTVDDIMADVSGTDASTGLPYLWEIGLGLLLVAGLVSYGGKARKSFQKSRKTRQRKKIRRAALKAELAAL